MPSAGGTESITDAFPSVDFFFMVTEDWDLASGTKSALWDSLSDMPGAVKRRETNSDILVDKTEDLWPAAKFNGDNLIE
jgi:hypothetical protein